MNWLFFPFLWVRKARLQQRLKGKTVLITGASFGIGECLAYQLAEAKAHLILVARTQEKLVEVQRKVQTLGGTADIYACDLSQTAHIEQLCNTLRLQKIDIVVANAGKSIRRSIYDSLDRFHDFTRTIQLNYLGHTQLLLALIPILEQQKGHIINISALNVLLIPAPSWAAYQASKTAFDQWFRCVAPELNAHSIGTSSIYLPLVRTRMIAPTKAYDRMPALTPEFAATLICKAIITRRRRFAPWWLLFAQLASVLFRWLWEWAMPLFLKRR